MDGVKLAAESRAMYLGPTGISHQGPEGRGFSGCEKALQYCHPERSEGPLRLNF
jgi:hypothetical protein